MEITTDHIVFWQHGPIVLNMTIVMTWGVMILLATVSWLITRHISSDSKIPQWQNSLEIIIQYLKTQISETGLAQPEKFIGFLGTLFIFIAFSNLLAIIPYYEPPTGSLSTTGALAFCVFVAVPFFGISERGLFAYLKSFCQPTIMNLPLNLLGEVSRTFALAVRLFGNIMSEGVIGGILLSIAPFFFPVLMHLFGLLTGLVQAYIFFILATVFITAAATGE
ncbi:MAG: F0F1 ATP synthase subunit A [Candidatus Riflebacteria bacterium]|nr:F0F1 ATP synthase subunit A [Candidatus Riflebacteria bacterium]